jgi:hypothetical protein
MDSSWKDMVADGELGDGGVWGECAGEEEDIRLLYRDYMNSIYNI